MSADVLEKTFPDDEKPATSSRPGRSRVGSVLFHLVAAGLLLVLTSFKSTAAELDDMYLATNARRHQVYDYTDDNACGYSCGRNVDHTIDVQALTGGYYGKGGVQGNTFAIEDWVFDRYDALLADLRTGEKSDAEVKKALTDFQNEIAATIRSNYEAGTVPKG